LHAFFSWQIIGEFVYSIMPKSSKKTAVDVVFPQPPWQRFTYEVADRFSGDLALGHRVLVPLGNRKMMGFVVEFVDHPTIPNLREIEDILDPYPLLTVELVNLTRWVADYYLATWGEVIRTALPPGLVRRSRLLVHSIKEKIPDKGSLTDLQEDILRLLDEREKWTLVSLQRRMGQRHLRYVLSSMEKAGLVRVQDVLEESKVRIKSEVRISLREKFDPADVPTLAKQAPRQAGVLRKLQEHGGEVRRNDLDVDFSVLRRMEENGYIEMWEEDVFREPYKDLDVPDFESFLLTEEQARVLQQIESGIEKQRFCPFLLHGVTASGKTQVYIEAIHRILELGKSALVLVPEISLTPQAVQRYCARFGDDVAVLHSRMSMGERYDSWRKIREGTCRIGLGPRSAVFAPLENLGLLIVDEEQESSYKQMDPAPRYHARDAAVMRAKLNDCTVILGSATPSVESYYNALHGKYTLCRLTHRIDHVPLPTVTLVDWNEQKEDKKSRVFSAPLKDKMKARLAEGEQVILLQNRRGYATFLRCGACGNIEECPHCDISLTYHQDGHRLKCHYCGFQKKATDVCPDCGGTTVQFRGVGTQRVEAEISQLFPGTRLFRMDQDTTRRKQAHHRIVTRFEKGEGDVLLGTQMVAKGHDFPGVNLVGIISADTGLHFPDFRSGERTFQLLTQAAGRAGRRDRRGEVVIQTQSPDHPVLRFAVQQDYVQYYQHEIQQREELGYPPWGRIILLRFKGKNEEQVAKAAHAFLNHVEQNSIFDCLGPVSAPLSRIKGMYRYHIVFKGKRPLDPGGKKLRGLVRRAIHAFYEHGQVHGVRLAVDVDPVDML